MVEIAANRRPSRDSSFAVSGGIVFWSAVAAWTALLGLVLAHRVFVTNDSLSNYAHVWYISERLKEAHTLPLAMPVLAHGDAYAYPYGFVPWTLAAFARFLVGDWAVTLALAGGFVLLVAAMFWALPELRARPLAALVLVNPFLVESFILGQLPFLWAAALLFAAIGFWRRGLTVAAVIAAAGAMGTHAAVMMPISGLLFLARLPYEPDRRRFGLAYLASVLLALPAAVIVLASPTLAEAGLGSALANLLGTVAVRSMVFVVPLAVAGWHERLPRRAFGVLALAMVLLLLPMAPLRRDGFAWGALFRRPDHVVGEFTRSAAFQPGATYRVLRAGDGKVSMFDVLVAGGRLDSEFFPESIDRTSFAGVPAYERFLAARAVDYVVVFDSYTRDFKTNEAALLGQMVRPGEAEVVFQGDTFDVYKIESVAP